MLISSGHEEAAAGLKFSCPRAAAVFPAERVFLANDAGPASLLLDEHGRTFVLRVEGLKVVEAPGPEAESGILLEVALPDGQKFTAWLESFAGRHRLVLESGSPTPELALRPTLAACHVPGSHLFVYAEDSQLQVRPASGQTLEIQVTGAFQARRVPCREADVVIHLTGPEMARLLSYLLSLAGT